MPWGKPWLLVVAVCYLGFLIICFMHFIVALKVYLFRLVGKWNIDQSICGWKMKSRRNNPSLGMDKSKCFSWKSLCIFSNTTWWLNWVITIWIKPEFDNGMNNPKVQAKSCVFLVPQIFGWVERLQWR